MRLPSRSREHLAAAGILLLFAAVLFAWPTFASDGRTILSEPTSDLEKFFIGERSFGVREIWQGNFPFWNPYVYCGSPYTTGFQAAVYYPPNAIYLVTPIDVAINLSLVLHVYLGALLMYFWARFHLARWWVCLTVGILFAGSGVFFPRVHAGHICNLSAMAWAPLILLAIDGWLQQRRYKWLLLGSLAVAMLSLAGHPQYIYIMGIAGGLYGLTQLYFTQKRSSAIAGLLIIVALGVGLAAVQLLTGFAESANTARAGGMTMEQASAFSLSPDNLLTLLLPQFFGPPGDEQYWGRWFNWEMVLFLSVTGALLAIAGLIVTRNRQRLPLVICIVITIGLALGKYLPVYPLLFDYLPMHSSFRSLSRFAVPATMFVLLLSGYGLDRLHRLRRGRIVLGYVAAAIGLSVLLVAWLLHGDAGAARLTSWMQTLHSWGDVYVRDFHADPAFAAAAASYSMKHCLLTAASLTLLAGFLFSFKRWPAARFALAGLAVVEITIFACLWCNRFDPTLQYPDETKQLLANLSPDERVFLVGQASLSAEREFYNIWGGDPAVQSRYAEFMAMTQGLDPDKAGQNVKANRISPLWRMLRCTYVIPHEENPRPPVPLNSAAPDGNAQPTIPRAMLIESYRVLPERDDAFRAMLDPQFDPAKHVILERRPTPAPASLPSPTVDSSPVGSVKITDINTDHLRIEATLSRPAILVITDAYAPGWRIEVPANTNSPQQATYDLQPANYALRGIALDKGEHHFDMIYEPAMLRPGLAASGISLLIWLSAASWLAFTRRWNSSL